MVVRNDAEKRNQATLVSTAATVATAAALIYVTATAISAVARAVSALALIAITAVSFVTIASYLKQKSPQTDDYVGLAKKHSWNTLNVCYEWTFQKVGVDRIRNLAGSLFSKKQA